MFYKLTYVIEIYTSLVSIGGCVSELHANLLQCMAWGRFERTFTEKTLFQDCVSTHTKFTFQHGLFLQAEEDKQHKIEPHSFPVFRFWSLLRSYVYVKIDETQFWQVYGVGGPMPFLLYTMLLHL